MRVREARSDDLPAVMGVLDGAMLEIELDRVRGAETLVAVDGDRVLGALVLSDTEIEAVAVRRRRRDRGVGTALVEAAAARRDRLVAAFDPDVRPFYEALGFAIEPCGDGRLRGVRE